MKNQTKFPRASGSTNIAATLDQASNIAATFDQSSNIADSFDRASNLDCYKVGRNITRNTKGLKLNTDVGIKVASSLGLKSFISLDHNVVWVNKNFGKNKLPLWISYDFYGNPVFINSLSHKRRFSNCQKNSSENLPLLLNYNLYGRPVFINALSHKRSFSSYQKNSSDNLPSDVQQPIVQETEDSSEQEDESVWGEENVNDRAEEFKNNRDAFLQRQEKKIIDALEEHENFARELREDVQNAPISSRTRSSNLTPENAEIAIQQDYDVTEHRIRGINNTTEEVKEVWRDWDDVESQSQPQSQSQSQPQSQSQSQSQQQSQSRSPLDYVLERQSESLPDYSDDLD